MKDCEHHAEETCRSRRRLILLSAAFFVAAVLFVVFVVFLILRPSKPSFVLQDITVGALEAAGNASSSTAAEIGGGAALTSHLQVTLATRNPNNLIGVYYDRLIAFAAYRGQEITLRTGLPASYQGHHEVVVWSPFVYGVGIPVAPYLAESLGQDEAAGAVLLNIKVHGRVRWKVGTWVSGDYRLLVNCPAFVPIGNKQLGTPSAIGIKYQTEHGCTVDV